MIGLGLQGSGSMAGKGGGCEAVAQGLRVRMGVASGVVPAGVNISNCSLLQLAKGEAGMRGWASAVLSHAWLSRCYPTAHCSEHSSPIVTALKR